MVFNSMKYDCTFDELINELQSKAADFSRNYSLKL